MVRIILYCIIGFLCVLWVGAITYVLNHKKPLKRSRGLGDVSFKGMSEEQFDEFIKIEDEVYWGSIRKN